MAEGKLDGRHYRWGWASLGVFALIGLALETLHGFKIGAYLDHETRRTMWRLAHAHGAVLGLIHLALAAQLRGAAEGSSQTPRASLALCVASVAMPLGFFLGGLWFYDADPGVGIVLVPLGAVALVYACLQMWLGARAR